MRRYFWLSPEPRRLGAAQSCQPGGSAFVRNLAVVVAALCAALAGAGAATAGDGFFVGVSDDHVKFESGPAGSALRSLGARSVRLTLQWSKGQTDLSASDRGWLDRATGAVGGDVRVVLSVYGASRDDAPLDDSAREQYCGFVRSALARYPRIHDVVIWNEVNKSHFWNPQFNADGSSAAPAAYEALLARCWDVLHGFRADVNLITSTSSRGNDNPNAASNVSHSPGNFIRQLGAAYRASGRTTPIFDTVGHHPYGEHSSERPWRSHPLSTTIGEGDWDKLTQAYHDAFAGSTHPIPGLCVGARCAFIWYLEVGYQTTPDTAKSGLYSGAENSELPLPAAVGGDPAGSTPDEKSLAPDQGAQLADAVRLAACQPYVQAYFNFLLRDEADLALWQSGVFWADWTPKPSLDAFRAATGEAAAGRVDCLHLKLQPPGNAAAAAMAPGAALAALFPAPRTNVPVLRVLWPPARTFNWRNDQWRFRVAAGEDATYRATLYQVSVTRKGRTVPVKPRPLRTAAGKLKMGYLSFVNFKRGRLPFAARYRIEVTIASAAAPSRTTRLVSPPFLVLPRPARR